MKLIKNQEYGLYEKGNKIFCDSLQIAETFNKRHGNVLRDIYKITKPTIGLITMIDDYQERKAMLTNYYTRLIKEN